MPKHPPTLLKSTRYTKFTQDRNAGLERIHQHTQVDLSRITFEMLERIEQLAAATALKAKGVYMTHQVSHPFEQGTKEIITEFFPKLVNRMMRMRKSVFILSYSAEMEAVGRATKRKKFINHSDFQKKLIYAMHAPTLEGPLDKRVWYALTTLRRKILQAFDLAVTQELPPEKILKKVQQAFPQVKSYRRPPKALTKLREASSPGKKQDWIDVDFVSDQDWQDAVDDYLGTTVPENRFDNLSSYEGEDGMSLYNWQLEQEATEDFVKNVMDGKVEGAEDMGVEEFVWIAVLDDRTDDCCAERNGLTTSEIADLGDDDDCDATVPPAHFNCRCDVGPVASTDEVEGPDWSSFNEWLES